MKTRVLKWLVPLDDQFHPIGAGPVMLVDMQGKVACVWTREDMNGTPVTSARAARVFGTGHEVPDGGEHLGSMVDAPFVWHVFAFPLQAPTATRGPIAHVLDGTQR